MWNPFQHVHHMTLIGAQMDVRAASVHPAIAAMMGGQGSAPPADKHKVTHIVYRCRCGLIHGETIAGHWTAEELNGKEMPKLDGDALSKALLPKTTTVT